MSEGLAAPETSSWSSSKNYPSYPATTSDSDSYSSRGRNSSSYKSKRQNDNLQPFAPGTHNLSLELGQAFLMGNLSSKYSDSIMYQAHYTYGVSDIFGFESSLGYSDHSDGQFNMTSLVSGLRTNFAYFDRVVPYGILGLGFYRPSMQVTATNSVSAMLFGLHLGGGVSLLLSKEMFFGAGVTFHDVFGTSVQTSAGNVDLGGTFTTFLLHVGYSFN